MATLRDVQKQQTRALLLANGLEQFGAKGYLATTIDDIAAAAGATRPTFYAHFAGKPALMMELIKEVDAILTTADDPPLTTVIELGRRELIRAWLDRKFDQWPVIRPYMLVAHQAEPSEPEVAATLDRWHDGTVEWMRAGLDKADRFDPASRRARCVLAFGEFEYLSRQWFRRGWLIDRPICLETLTDSWFGLLGGE